MEANRERDGKREADWLELAGKWELRLELKEKWGLRLELNAEQRLDWEREAILELNWEQREVQVPNNRAASRLSAGEMQNGADCTKRSSWRRKEEAAHYERESRDAPLTLSAPSCRFHASGCSAGIPCDPNSTRQSDARRAHFS